MNPKKRKAEDEDSCDLKQEESKINESETTDVNASNCRSDECSNSTDQQKSDNGGSSERPGTSNDNISEDDSKDASDQSSDQREKKLSVSNHVLLFTECLNCL